MRWPLESAVFPLLVKFFEDVPDIVTIEGGVMKKSAICMMVLFLVLLAAGAANAGRAITLMQVRATILPWLRYTIIAEPAALVVTASEEQENERVGEHGRDEADDEADKESRREEGEKKYAAEKRAIEIERGTLLSVDTNTTDGYVLSVQSFESNAFTTVKIKVEDGGPSFALAPGGSVEVHLPYNSRRSDVIALSYDFSISPYAEAGSYPWPIIVTVHPL